MTARLEYAIQLAQCRSFIVDMLQDFIQQHAIEAVAGEGEGLGTRTHETKGRNVA
jgi:hypothetical protein